jgi:nucleotide-binding universal stress UspA family protein
VQQIVITDRERRLMNSLVEIRRTEFEETEDVGVELECTALLSIAGAICQFAISKSVDLIVLATTGRTSASYGLTKSVTEEIVRRSPCPVLVVRADNYIKIKNNIVQGANRNADPA